MFDPNKLLGCPFCGKPAELRETKHIPDGVDYTPRCTDTSCCGRSSKKYTDKKTAIAKWNMRKNPSSNLMRNIMNEFEVGDEIVSNTCPTLFGTILNIIDVVGGRVAIVESRDGKELYVNLSHWRKVKKEKEEDNET